MDESWIFHLHRVSKKQNKLTPEASAIAVIHFSASRVFRYGFEISFNAFPNFSKLFP